MKKLSFKFFAIILSLAMILSTVGVYALSVGMDERHAPSMPKPQKGVPFIDPLYGTTVVRATDHEADGFGSYYIKNDYSRRQAFNADNSKYLVQAGNGKWCIYVTATYELFSQPDIPTSDIEPQWSPTDPNVLYYLTPLTKMVIYKYDIIAETKTVVVDFSDRLPWPNAARFSTGSEGSPSADGRYWGFMVSDSQSKSLGFFTWDMETDKILGTYDTFGNKPNHVSMSATGKYFISSWWGEFNGVERGTVAFSRDFKEEVCKLNNSSEHSDLALDGNGNDVFVSIDYDSPNADVYMITIESGVKTVLFPNYIGSSHASIHVSGKSFSKPGWAVISTYNSTGPTQWYSEKVFAVELKPDPRIICLANTHNLPTVIKIYEAETQASVSRDFTKILFNSSWESTNFRDVDVYMVQLNPGDIPVSIIPPLDPSIHEVPFPTALPTPSPTPSPSPTPTPTHVSSISVQVNTKLIKLPYTPVMVSSEVFAPAEALVKALGGKYKYTTKTKTITITKSKTTIVLKIGSKIVKVNGKKTTLKNAPKIVKVPFVPIKFIGEKLGYNKYTYSSNTKIVSLKK